MKVLWVCNVPNQQACNYLKYKEITIGGWLTGLSKGFQNVSDISLIYCFPGSKKQIDFVCDNIHYYSFYSPNFFGVPKNKQNRLQDKQIKTIIEKEKPDIIHFFGTEYYHSLIFLKYSREIKKVCSIQGLTSVYSKHYYALLPNNIIHKRNLSSLVKGTISKQAKELKKRGEYEVELLKKCENVIGRTDWDFCASYLINKQRKYYLCNETLRDGFYKTQWQYDKCVKHRIFMAQASSPIKGLNIAIEALSFLVDEYPDIQLHIAGNDFTKKHGILNRLKYSTYAQYIEKLIKRRNLEKHVVFCGNLSETQMIDKYLSSNVFISPSSIENSSNSIGEAMLLGLPVISSDVGGIKSLMNDANEGLLYQADAPYMLAFLIKKLFDHPEEAILIGKNARIRASKTHAKDKNFNDLRNTYYSIMNK